LQQVATACGLSVGAYPIQAQPWRIDSDEDFESLVAMLESRDRRLPVLVASGDERSDDPSAPLIDADTLARATLGLAHVVVMPATRTYALSDAFGKVRAVYHGGVRIYLPGFDSASDPYAHRLVLGETIRRDAERSMSDLRAYVANESLRRTRLGKEVLPFAAVRSAALRLEQEQRVDEDASEAEQLATAYKRIEALEAEVKATAAEAEQSLEMAEAEEERANAAEALLNAAQARIQALQRHLAARGLDSDTEITIPDAWDDFPDWCDQAFVGRLVLAPTARKGVRRPLFSDVQQAARGLNWLASTCRDRRISGGGSLANIPIGEGLENAPCGSDSFAFDFQGRRLQADWHVKSGGNTRDPVRCLRIYYAFDEMTQQIIIADMPAHRTTGAS
jgi:hypothetical protein